MRARASRGKKVIGPNRAARVNHSRTKELLTLPYKGASLLGRGHFTFHTTYFNRRTAVPCRLQIWIKCVREDETFSPFQATLLLIWLIDTRTHLRFEGLFVFLHKCGAERSLSALEGAEKITDCSTSAYLHDNWALAFSGMSARRIFGEFFSNHCMAFDCTMMTVIMLMNLLLRVISFMRIPALCKCP